MPVPKSSFVGRLIRWRFLIVVNLFVVAFLGMSLGREVVRSRSITAEITTLQNEAESLVTRNIEISELKTAMQTESYIEREARLKLGLQKPGETVVVIQDDSNGENTLSGTDPTDPLGYMLEEVDVDSAVANPTKWWYYFFDKNSFNVMSDYE